QPQPELLSEAPESQRAAEARIAELESECERLRTGERRARAEMDHQAWLVTSHRQANFDGVLILSAAGEVLSWNPAFIEMWKLSEETMTAHTWATIAAHMESQVESGWDDFRKATAHAGESDSCWEMTLEGGRLLEV